jgi:ethanolamine ammonia-lyase small subunit
MSAERDRAPPNTQQARGDASHADALQADPWNELARLTPARIALGRSGSGLLTREVLRLAQAHAQARDAVHAKLDENALARELEALECRTIKVASAANGREAYLRRPDHGRRLSPDARAYLDALHADPCDIALVVADGLCATAAQTHAANVVAAFLPLARRNGWSLAPVTIATQARVALGDEIGALMQARVVAMLIGERPGLSSPDSLGIYVTYDPSPGRNDAQRNCISNIRGAGLSPEEAAFRLAWLVGEMLARRISGVDLKDESDLAVLSQEPRGS